MINKILFDILELVSVLLHPETIIILSSVGFIAFSRKLFGNLLILFNFTLCVATILNNKIGSLLENFDIISFQIKINNQVLALYIVVFYLFFTLQKNVLKYSQLLFVIIITYVLIYHNYFDDSYFLNSIFLSVIFAFLYNKIISINSHMTLPYVLGDIFVLLLLLSLWLIYDLSILKNIFTNELSIYLGFLMSFAITWTLLSRKISDNVNSSVIFGIFSLFAIIGIYNLYDDVILYFTTTQCDFKWLALGLGVPVFAKIKN